MHETFEQQLKVNGYSAIEPLYLGSRTLVYRAVRLSDQAPVILKRLRNEAPTVEEQARFRNQYELTKDLNIPGIVQVIGLETCGGSDVLLMKDCGGMSLAEYLKQCSVSIVQFLSIAVQLSSTLHELHQANIIHKDIKPSNIVIRPESMQVQLMDFSIASQLSSALKHPNQLEGTLAYLSPEQTGRINCSIDYRSDFYSLGVTFYEMLTGQVPFVGEDALEIVHGHLAKEPTPIQAINPEVPEAIAQIITKLMAKNAEDRYQSAKGLQADLQRCLEEWKATGSIAPFKVGKVASMRVTSSLEYSQETTLANQRVLANSSTKTSTSTSTELLDLAAIIKATEAISSELRLDQLLDRLLHIILENAGSQKGCIVLERDGELFIEVADTNQDASEVIVEAIPLAQSQDFPLTVLQYVERTQSAIVFTDATVETICASDPYVLSYSPKSLLCTPILYQGKFIGLVYLENNLVRGAFTHNRLETVNILIGQAAIAIENARLFACIQDKAAALERSEKRLSKLFEQSADATFIFDPERMIFIDCNQAAIKLLGFAAKEQLIGLSPSDISPERQADGRTSIGVASEVVTLTFEKGSHRFEWLARKADGQPIWLEIILTVITFDDQPILHGIWRDLTDRKQAEAALRDSQAQLIQAEKMSALGNLVAGVAHEINNPIGFLNGSITNAKDFVQDLLEHLELYEQQYPNSETMEAHAEEIDLEFLKADLPKLLNSMKTAIDRIKSISSSLRTFSRADTENAIVANIHEGIDSTILILKYRLKENEHRPAIEVVTNYGTIPNIECFPGQLNQVFMNILANAIDVFDESQQSHQMITIQTAQIDQNTVEIRLRDNGKGMPDDVKSQVFDHLFTTKTVGKGTGLGLSIARQIIVEKHRGSIEVHSELGRGSEFVISIPINQSL